MPGGVGGVAPRGVPPIPIYGATQPFATGLAKVGCPPAEIDLGYLTTPFEKARKAEQPVTRSFIDPM